MLRAIPILRSWIQMECARYAEVVGKVNMSTMEVKAVIAAAPSFDGCQKPSQGKICSICISSVQKVNIHLSSLNILMKYSLNLGFLITRSTAFVTKNVSRRRKSCARINQLRRRYVNIVDTKSAKRMEEWKQSMFSSTTN